LLKEVLTSNNYSARIIAGNELNVVAESNVSPEVHLSIVRALDYSNPMPEASPTFVENFCKKNTGNAPSYEAGALAKWIVPYEIVDENAPQEEEINTAFVFDVYPNPTNGITTISFNSFSEQEVYYRVVGMLGNTILEGNINILKGVSTFDVDLSSYADGIYYVNFMANGTTKTAKIIKR
jgi:hypothetical protein